MAITSCWSLLLLVYHPHLLREFHFLKHKFDHMCSFPRLLGKAPVLVRIRPKFEKVPPSPQHHWLRLLSNALCRRPFAAFREVQALDTLGSDPSYTLGLEHLSSLFQDSTQITPLSSNLPTAFRSTLPARPSWHSSRPHRLRLDFSQALSTALYT